MRWLRTTLLPGLLLAVPLHAQFWSLPDWAHEAVKAAASESAPEGADAWVLLDHTVWSYRGEGELRKTRTRVVRILTQRGLSEATFQAAGYGSKVSRILKLRGWNLRPDGSITRIDRDDLVGIDADVLEERKVSARTLSLATLTGVQTGSVVAFESQESSRPPLGPIELAYPLEKHPIRQYSFETGKELRLFSSSRGKDISFRLDARNLEAWSKSLRKTDHSLELTDLPALPPDEPWASVGLGNLPFISLVYTDPLLDKAPNLLDWMAYGKWVHGRYLELADAAQPVPLAGKGPKEALLALMDWMRQAMTYRQVYLSPERGWVPERSTETIRRRYGDCKDLATCLISGARAASLEAWPVLARIEAGRLPEDVPVNPFVFNHVICAVRLDSSLGLPAEVDTPRGRFVLVDPTSRTTPLGWLPEGHRGGRLLLCGPEGATWVEVPNGALQERRIDFRIEGFLAKTGEVRGTLRVLETGNALGLRSKALLDGEKGLREQTLTLSPQSLPNIWTVKSNHQPANLDTPFEVAIQFEYPGAFLLKGAEGHLRLPSFPMAPQPFQKQKGKRRFPLEVAGGVEYHWQVSLRFEQDLPGKETKARIDGLLRTANWSSSLVNGELTVAFDLFSKPATWSVADQDVGFAALKRDRSEFLAFLDDVLYFPLARRQADGRN